MVKIKVVILLLIVAFAGCEKSSEKGDLLGSCCLPNYYYSLEADSASYGFGFSELFFMPSAFTPNGDLLNDQFRVWFSTFNTSSYEVSCRILYKNALVFQFLEVDATFIFWDGKSPDGEIYPGVYRAEVQIYKDRILYKDIKHYFKLINQQSPLPLIDTCQTFGDVFDTRLGIIYESVEEFQ